ncbi:hypothetical protein B0J13DRAFT_562548 [Dactylonectria estremocensis]|uniref:Microbial-type PARG catalytic domain-containing protein n=1 Tax=Dactylonectria estremocensis TaxID=1079267 RepID=A0A9P9E7J3_9HYPO|nr:hypothetical protein B0J13DRAFT_562548 [Dactylonectria estremocensis]
MASSPGQGTLDTWLSKKPSSRPSQPAPSSAHPATSSSAESAPAQPSQYSKSTRSKHKGSFRRGAELAAVAKETRTVLPDILQELPNIHASRSEALYSDRLPPLKAADCPKRTASGKTVVKIVNDDSFNAAITLADSKTSSSGRVAVLNMASNISPGGGWLKGARAQEEALCYRSSLYLSLHRRYYPWKQRMGIYTPDVVIIRSDQDSGHNLLMPDVSASDLPVVSVLSIAGLRTPPVDRITLDTPGGTVEKVVYSRPSDRELTKTKMRLCLRMAAHRGHGLLVLGALGCGAFRNPPKEVANCWLEVLKEAEFQGGWWEEVWFAVFDKRNEGNLEIFEDVLGDVEI